MCFVGNIKRRNIRFVSDRHKHVSTMLWMIPTHCRESFSPCCQVQCLGQRRWPKWFLNSKAMDISIKECMKGEGTTWKQKLKSGLANQMRLLLFQTLRWPQKIFPLRSFRGRGGRAGGQTGGVGGGRGGTCGWRGGMPAFK